LFAVACSRWLEYTKLGKRTLECLLPSYDGQELVSPVTSTPRLDHAYN
jgi:hypothetical protein